MLGKYVALKSRTVVLQKDDTTKKYFVYLFADAHIKYGGMGTMLVIKVGA
jgi:hypothetical protein